ncbi:MAG TPA: hypothetical protein DCS43_13645 [Verrucomicrobia bacterium]|nr:hypothetical protein [Verrucomicrobiota bacterium]
MSLTANGAWVKQVEHALNVCYPNLVKITNCGGSGKYSAWGVQNIKEKVIALKPDAVFIEFAMNDSVERFQIPIEKAKANLETMIDCIQIDLGIVHREALVFLSWPLVHSPSRTHWHSSKPRGR